MADFFRLRLEDARSLIKSLIAVNKKLHAICCDSRPFDGGG
jgi:hypothetical protein